MLSRAILAKNDILLNPAEMKRLALFFDNILVWKVEPNKVCQENHTSIYANQNFLREKGLVKNVGIFIPCDTFVSDNLGSEWDIFDIVNKDTDIFIPFEEIASLHNPQSHTAVIDNVDRIIRHIAPKIFHNIDKSPIVAHLSTNSFDTLNTFPTAIELVIKNIPLPPDNIPWEDLIQFRSESENISKLRALRIWIQKQATNPDNPRLMLQELEALTEDYKKYMRIQHQKYSRGILSTVLSSAAAVVGQLESGNYSEALLAMLSMRSHKLALEEAEMNAPGREVSYLVKASQFADQAKR
ncbi:MAG: hypothetical protein JAZ11_21620 [Candidatus Thiodiazotropha lotti]|nr:hypothetical protein [Candidatus Thiodiazotropha lotti]